MGVTKESDRCLRLPIRIRTTEGSRLDLVPVDYFTAAFVAIMLGGRDGGLFHIVNHSGTTIGTVVDYTRRFFNLTGLECTNGRQAGETRNALETLFDVYNAAYAPYMQDERIFDDTRAAALLVPAGITCPDLDFDTFSRCIDYAIRSRWGLDLDGKADAGNGGETGVAGEGRA